MSEPQNTPEIPPVVAPTPTPETQDPNWLQPRLEQAARSAERKVLESLGVTDVASASKAIAAAKAAEEAGKSAETRAAELAASLKVSQTETERLTAATRGHADTMLGVLSAEQQAAVKAIAGDDAAKQLQAIKALAPTWSSQEPPKPVNTAPVGGPPSDPTSPPDHRASYEALKSTNPFKAAAYAMGHFDEVYKPRS